MKRFAPSRYTSCPPPTEPVKLTYPTSGRAMICAHTSWVASMAVTRFSGAPALSNARAKASPQSAVRWACLTITALPASTDGTTTLTVIRSG